MSEVSSLQKARYSYQPKLPALFAKSGLRVKAVDGAATSCVGNPGAIKPLFPNSFGRPIVSFQAGGVPEVKPLKIGVLLSGGQAPGGHNIISGLFDALRKHHPESRLFGFENGPGGLVKNKYREIDAALVDRYRNTGGFDIIGSDRTKLESEEKHIIPAVENCRKLGLDALVIVGGDDSNTNGGMLAEYLLAKKNPLLVIGCPKTIDGDLKNEYVETSFGFDTASKLYSELIGNIATDVNSAKKYWHFIRLMGRSASHITLECALQTHANIAIISEEVEAKKQTLKALVEEMVGVIAENAEGGRNFGVVLIPEGLLEFIPEMKVMVQELNEILAKEATAFNGLATDGDRIQFVSSRLTQASEQALSSLPVSLRVQLLMERDKAGNVPFSKIETERLIIDMVGARLKEMKAAGKFKGEFSAQNHFLGYEGRCSPPSNFDADYCYSLGFTAAALAAAGKTGYMAVVRNLSLPHDQWQPGGIPLTTMMNIERRKGKDMPVIRKSLVELDSAPFKKFAGQRDSWKCVSAYLCPGPIQFFGPSEVCDRTTITMELEASSR
ncbi:MAG: diphosphate--fructose-6-phosphate 1-phosphotransferase [bacterium]